MDWNRLIEQILSWVGQYPIGGFMVATGLSAIEAFFPPLPLVAIVTGNIFALGFVFGALASWTGSVIGTYSVFIVIQFFFLAKFERYRQKHNKINQSFKWIQDKGFIPIALMYVFPFTPSFMVSGLAALAEIKHRDFFVSVVIGKFFMILSLSVIGWSFTEILDQPWISIGIIGFVFILSAYAKKYLNSLQKKHFDRYHNRKEEIGNENTKK